MSAAALRAEGAGDSTPASDGGERITRLFPKCRPRNMQRAHDRVVLEGREMNNVNNLSSDDDRGENINHNSKDPYKLRDSRIIEIAGGRELYSASRTKALRKLRQNTTQKHNIRNKRTIKDSMDYTTDNLNTEISLTRLANDKRVITRHSPPYTNGDCDSSHTSIPRNSSPVLDPHKAKDGSTKSSPIAVVADGEVVVFDDDENWKVILNSVSVGMRTDGDSTDNDDKRLDNIRRCDSVVATSEGSFDGDSESTPSAGNSGNSLRSGNSPSAWLSGDDERDRVTRVIGELPIAEYEGSPRRYGVGTAPAQLNNNTSREPRPGFPQRVVTESRGATPPSSSAAFDYLYEFSETRKVLEEFFSCAAIAGHHQADDRDHFQELEYELRRAGESGDADSPRGSWAQLASPHTAHNHTDFLGLQQSSDRGVYSRAGAASGLSVGAAWSGAASPARPAPAAPAPSACARSDIHADLATMLMEDELAELKGITECPRGVSVQLPVVEDGLSSGHASDTDNNNQVDSLKTHTSLLMEVTNGDPHQLSDVDLHSLDPLVTLCGSPPPPAPAPHRDAAPPPSPTLPTENRKRPSSAQSTESLEIKPCASGDEDEADTDLETDRLLGQQRTDDQGFFDDKGWRKPKSRTVMPAGACATPATPRSPPLAADHNDNADDRLSNKDKDGKKKSKNKEDFDPAVLIEGVLFRARYLGSTQLACEGQPTKATRMLQAEEAVSRIKCMAMGPYSSVYAAPAAVFRLAFLGSVELDDAGPRAKRRPKKYMVEDAVTRIKAPEGENQPSTEVDLFISTEKIMVLNTELKEIMMDHALRTISYIADIGDLVVLMARRRYVPQETDSDQPKLNRTPKMICHVFESEEAQFIAQSIGQAFQVAYMEFLKANGIEDHSFVKEMDYQEVLNSQEIFGDELQMFAKKELQKEVVVPKAKGEILGVVVVESGWGSMLPTVVIANLAPAGAAARCSHLNIGDQIIAINGVSLVGLPLSTCQTYIKNSKNQTVVKLTVVPCAPVVEVKIKRPDTKYQLGFSVQNGVICSLLRGGIAERGGVRVGHRIIEINCQSVVAVPHERIVNLLATSVGEILMKTMPTSMFRLLTGQENPVFI